MLEDVVERVRGHHTAVQELRDGLHARAAATTLSQVRVRLHPRVGECRVHLPTLTLTQPSTYPEGSG